MRAAVRRGIAAAVLAAAVAMPSGAETTGDVMGVKESMAASPIFSALTREEQALQILILAEEQEPLPPETASSVTLLLQESIAYLEQATTALQIGGPYQSNTEVAAAEANIRSAIASDNKALAYIAKEIPPLVMKGRLEDAIRSKKSAIQALGGVKTSKKDGPAIAENGTDPATIAHDAEISGTKKDAAVTGREREDGTGDSVDANGKVKPVPPLKDYDYLTLAAAPKPVKKFYYAFEGKKATPGYHFKSFGRRLFGPFETRFQVGAFNPNRFEDTGSACIEFDLEGSDPLQYVAVCGRRISGGVQVFVQSNAGSGGSLFIPGARIAQVLVDYDGTTFTVTAGVEGTPDEFLSLVGSATMAQEATALIAGLGASGLTKGAEIGLDEIYFTAK